jgi:hypothetical protein
VVEDIAELSGFNKAPWTNGFLQGLIDAPYLNLTPGTRTGIIQTKPTCGWPLTSRPSRPSY